jgi:hypothetical protein
MAALGDAEALKFEVICAWEASEGWVRLTTANK